MHKHLGLLWILLIPTLLFATGSKEEPRNQVTITWWHSNSGLLGEATDKLVSSFNETVGRQEGITVKAIYQGKASDVLTKAKAIWQGEDASALPDLIQLDAQAILDIRDNPRMIPIQDLAQQNGYDLSQIVESTRLSQTYKGQIIGMPFNSSTILLYYNKTAFQEAGITEPPKDLEAMAAIAPKLVRKDASGNVTRWAFSGVPTTYELCAWLGQQHGLSLIVDQNNGHDGIPTKVLFDENGTMQTFLKMWKALYQSGGLENATSGVTASFASGRTAMMAASTSQLTTVLEMVGDRFEVGVAYLPRVNDQATGGVNIGGGALYALENGSGHRDAAWKFIQYAVSKEQQLAWHVATGYFPVNNGTYDMDEFKTHVTENPLFGIAIDQMRDSNPQLQGIWVPSSYQIYYAFQSSIMKMLTEGKDINTATADMAREINGYFSAYRATQE
jgi:sn-glycerol 3-phosphate transport system substrate-binding protein